MSLTALLLSLIIVIVMGLLASLEDNFSRVQMAAKGTRNGFPFLRHTGMWGDLLLVTPALGIIGMYADQWSVSEVAEKLMIATAVSIVLHIAWSKMTKVQEHILGPNLTFTASGLVHAFYLTGSLAAILLFYMNTFNVDSGDALIVTTLLMIHLPLANAFVGYMKSGHFDAPGVIGTVALMAALGYVHWTRF